MDDQTIRDLAAQVDTVLIDLCMKNGTGPLTLSGIILARLTWFNDITDQGSDFRELCGFISNQPVRGQSELLDPVSDCSQAKQLLRKFQKPNE